MSDPHWDEVRKLIEDQGIEVGPYFGHQIRNSPRHLLFTLARYKFAAKMLPQDRTVRVLELGCSEGIGTLLLAERGHQVMGVDGDDKAIAHARRILERPNLRFEHSDFIGRDFGTFDAVVSLDVIEHVDRSREDDYVRTITRNLTREGFCVVGTPNDTASKYASKASQIGHINMYEAERLAALLGRHFSNVFMFGMNDEVLHTGFSPMCHYLMALACSPR
jgi:2-polyprenyl-3-methyl-5-hydroxy-6-metoxy-1,4-benzoquinol methylase